MHGTGHEGEFMCFDRSSLQSKKETNQIGVAEWVRHLTRDRVVERCGFES